MTEEKIKVKKKKGPIRTGAVIPFIVFTTLTIVFNIYFLDATIQKTMEFVGGKINGAEVNIGSVHSSFKKLTIDISKIQFTNKKIPTENLFSIEKIKFNLLWDAILRGKGVIELAEIKGILLGQQRKKTGVVYPVEIDKKTGNNKLTQETLEKVEKEFNGNVFGDIAGVMAGGSTGDITDEVKNSLESKKRFEALNLEIKTAKVQFDKDLKALPSGKELNQLKARFNNIRWKDLSNLIKAPKILQEADKLNKDINKALKSYDDVSKNTQSKINQLNNSYKEAESYISKDLNSISSRMNLPKLDQNSIARMLFGGEVLEKVKEAKKYQAMAQKYMPEKKEKPVPVKKLRGKGRDYQFGKPNSYPLFWLKLAKINSENKQGKISGKIENVTNDQTATGKLTELQVKGDFPPLNIRGVYGSLVLDHRKSPIAKLAGGVKSYLMENKTLSDSKDVQFILEKSAVNMKVSGTLQTDLVDLKIDNRFTNIVYKTKAKSPAVDEVLKDVATKTKVLTLDAKAKGSWNDIKFDIKSNLAKAIESSVRSLVKEKIEAAQKKIRDDIEKQISGAKNSATNELNKIKGEYTKQMEQAKNEMNKIKAQIKAEEKKAKKALKNPFKGIKL